MTIKQQGGVFGRHPNFSSVEIDGVGVIQKSGSDLEIAAPSGVKITGPSFWGLDVDGGVQIQDDFLRILRNANTSYAEIGVDATSAYLKSTFSSGGTSDFRFLRNSSEIMRITANGITFGGDTAAANALDDYEEGTWTPVVADAATGGNLCTMSGPIYTFGSYTKVGRMVHIQGCIRITGVTGVTTANVAYITGLPFTPDASQNTLTGGYVTRANYIDTPAGCVNLGLFVRTDGAMMVTTAVDSGVAATLTIANIQSINTNHFLAFNAAYYV